MSFLLKVFFCLERNILNFSSKCFGIKGESSHNTNVRINFRLFSILSISLRIRFGNKNSLCQKSPSYPPQFIKKWPDVFRKQICLGNNLSIIKNFIYGALGKNSSSRRFRDCEHNISHEIKIKIWNVFTRRWKKTDNKNTHGE